MITNKNMPVKKWVLASLCWLAILSLHADLPLDMFPPGLFSQVEDEYGGGARKRVEQWHSLVVDTQDSPESDKLLRVNTFFNRIRFIDDIRVWKQEDYWATPVEFLGRNAGDCEDFSIAKYFTLRALGISSEKLRLMYVRALKLNRAHMVLAYFKEPDAMPLILDNINRKILPADQRRDLQPIYSFNGDGLWAAKAQGRGRKIRNKSGHSSWRAMMNRIEHNH